MDITEFIHGQESSIILSLIENMHVFVEHDKTLVLDSGKLFLLAKICKQICQLLDEQGCEYSIDTYQDPVAKKRVWVQVETCSLDIQTEMMPVLRELLNEISALSFHASDDGLRMVLCVNDVYVEASGNSKAMK